MGDENGSVMSGEEIEVFADDAGVDGEFGLANGG